MGDYWVIWLLVFAAIALAAKHNLRTKAEEPVVVQTEDRGQGRVVITDIQMPFGSMVVFMVKWAIAAIPAAVILGIIGSVGFILFSALIQANS